MHAQLWRAVSAIAAAGALALLGLAGPAAAARQAAGAHPATAMNAGNAGKATTGRAATVTGAASTSENAPWWDANYNAADSRANLNEKVLTPATVTKVKYLRSVTEPPPTGCVQYAITSPVLAGGDLYAVTGHTVSKYNAATGALIWRRNPDPGGGIAYSGLALSGNLVIIGGYLCTSVSAQYGDVWAYNAITGKLVWSDLQNLYGPVNSVVKYGSYVVTQGADGGADFQTSVYDLNSGQGLWSKYTNGVGPAMVVGGQVISTDGNNGNMLAYDPATGNLAWSDPTSPIWWTPQAGDQGGSAGKHLFATDGAGTVRDVNPATGKVVYPLAGAGTVLAVDSTRVYATCGSGKDVCAWNITTGTREWQFADPAGGVTLAAEAGGVLYLDDGIALNAATGKVITRIWTSTGGHATALAIGDGRIAVVTGPRTLKLNLYGLSGY